MGFVRGRIFATASLLLCLGAAGAFAEEQAEPPPQRPGLRDRIRTSGPRPLRRQPIRSQTRAATDKALALLRPDQLVALLGHENWRQREQALHALRVRAAVAARGGPKRRAVDVLASLAAGMRSRDEEIAIRCAEILRGIGAPALPVVEPLATPQVEPRVRNRARAFVMAVRGSSWIGVHIYNPGEGQPALPGAQPGALGESLSKRARADQLRLDLPHTRGVIVKEVIADMPAQRAGFAAGDFIVAFDGVRVANVAELILAVGSTPAGKLCRARIFRQGRWMTLSVAPINMPQLDPATGRPRRVPAVPAKK